MHPKSLLLIILLVYVRLSYAQAPSLSYFNVPIPGDSLVFYLCKSVGPGSAGTNITWDFSHLTLKYNNSIAGQVYHSCPYRVCNMFPGSQLISTNYANMAFGNYVEDETYIHDTSKLSVNGIALWGSPDYVYTDPRDLLRFPFTYNDSFSDNYSYYMYNQSSMVTNGSVMVKADAYGKLILPYDTIANAIRVYTRDTFVNPSNQHFGYETYTWYASGKRWPLLIITWNNPGAVDTMLTYYQGVDNVDNYIPEIGKAELSVNVYPNPIRQQVNIDFDNPGSSNVDISLTDMTGRRMATIANKSFSAGKQHIQYALSDLAKGLYFIRLQSDLGTVTKKIEVL